MTLPAGDRRSVGASGFARLIEALHDDPHQAAHEYERLRRALIKFFDWRGAWPSDECTDEVFDRLAHKLEDTVVHDVRKYAYGIARLVLLEHRRAPASSPIDDAPVEFMTTTPSGGDDSQLDECFDRCLAELPDDSRHVVLRYYEGERSAKIANRRRLASALGVTDTALRNRVQRLRDRLEQCVRACTSGPLAETP